jgi:hypothetical protein
MMVERTKQVVEFLCVSTCETRRYAALRQTLVRPEALGYLTLNFLQIFGRA